MSGDTPAGALDLAALLAAEATTIGDREDAGATERAAGAEPGPDRSDDLLAALVFPPPRDSRDRSDGLGDPAAEAVTEPVTEPVVGSVAEPDDEDDEDDGEADLQDRADGQEVDDEAGRSTVPTFGLLFQAPQAAPAPAGRRARAGAAFGDPFAGAPGEAVDSLGDDSADEADDSDGDADSDTPTAPVPTRRRRAASRGRGPARPALDTDDDSDDSGDQSDAAADEDADDEDDDGRGGPRRRRRRGGKGRRRTSSDDADGDSRDDAGEEESPDEGGDDTSDADSGDTGSEGGGRKRTRRRRRSGTAAGAEQDPPGTVTKVREPRREREVATGIRGSTRLEAKRQRRREGREAGRRRTIITEAEFLARRESVERVMVVRQRDKLTQIGVLEDGVLVEHYISGPGAVSHAGSSSMAGNVYLGRVQNVLPSMEAAFVDIGKGRNAVLYAGEVNWDAAGLEQHKARRIENALSSGQSVLVQVTKDPIGHKGARLTSQVSLPGRYLVYVPDGSMTGISRKLPDTERARLKRILREIVPADAGVIVRTAAEGASEEELRADVERLTKEWERIQAKATSGNAPSLLHGEPDLTVRVVRDVFNEDFSELVVSGDEAWATVSDYVHDVAGDLEQRLTKWTGEHDVFAHYRIGEQLTKAMDRKVWLPSGGSLVIDRTEAMTVVDVNTGKFTGAGGNLEETVTKNNLEAAEEIVRQLRLRDIGGIIVIDFIDMVLEANRDLVVRRLMECLGRDRTKHQVAEVTSLGLVQMTRKRVGAGLIEVFSEPCESCAGRGLIVHTEPVQRAGDSGSSGHSGHSGGSGSSGGSGGSGQSSRDGGRDSRRGRRGRSRDQADSGPAQPAPQQQAAAGPTPAQIAAAAYAAAVQAGGQPPADAEAQSHEGVAPEVSEAISGAVSEALRDVAAGLQDRSGAPESVDSDARGGREPSAAVEAVVSQPAAVAPPEPAPRRRGGRRAVRAAASAPAGTGSTGVFVASDAGGSAEVAQVLAAASDPAVAPADVPSAGSDAESAAESTPPSGTTPSGTTPSRRTRGRGRVVAPAGPPTAGSGEFGSE